MSKPKTSKLLNLDDLATDVKVIVLDGTEHPMKELSVQEFIDKAREAQKLSEEVKDGEATVSELPMDEKIKAIVKMIADAFPTITVERLGQLALPQLNAILAFTFATPEEIEADVKAAQGNE